MNSDQKILAARPALRKGLWSVAGFILFVLALLLVSGVVLYVTKGSFLRDPMEKLLSAQTGRSVAFDGPFELYPRPHIKFHAENIRMGNPDWAEEDDFFTAEQLDFEINLWRLLTGSLTFNEFWLSQADLELQRGPDDRATWIFGESSSEPSLEIPVVRQGSITRTRIHYLDAEGDFDLTLRIGDVEASQKGFNQPLIIEGNGHTRGERFMVKGRIEQPDSFFRQEGSEIALELDAARSHAVVAGRLPTLSSLQDAELALKIAGRSLHAPFALIGVVIPETRRYRLRGKLKVDDETWRFHDLGGRIGSSDISGTLHIAPMEDDRLFLGADLMSRTLDILDVGPIIGMSPEALERQGGEGAIYSGPDETPRVLPDGPLNVDALDRFDAHVRYRAESVRAPGLPLENVRLDFVLKDRRLFLDPLAIDLAKGRAVARIDINARREPVVTRYDIDLRGMRLSSFFEAAGVMGENTVGLMRGRVQLTGEGPTVHESLASADGRLALVIPAGKLNLVAAELAKLDVGNLLRSLMVGRDHKTTEIRCGLIGFTVKDGIAKADPILIDTNTGRMEAKGEISFKDESLNLEFESKSKDFSLVSGQSPILIGGHFAEPAINPVSGELAARTGAAVALGVIAAPLAALLAFVDVGDAEDAACSALLKGLPAEAEEKAREARDEAEKPKAPDKH